VTNSVQCKKRYRFDLEVLHSVLVLIRREGTNDIRQDHNIFFLFAIPHLGLSYVFEVVQGILSLRLQTKFILFTRRRTMIQPVKRTLCHEAVMLC
jgi:hypothetical protein